MNILLIEDNPGDVILIKKYLSSENTNIINCKSLVDAKNLLVDNKFDLLIVDLSLPDSDSDETVEELSYICLSTPIIVITGSTRPDIIDYTAKFGAFFHFNKSELPSPFLKRAIRYATIYYGSDEERNARKQVELLNKTKSFFEDMDRRTKRKLKKIDDETL